MQTTIDQAHQLLDEIKVEVEKFGKGNDAAGGRARKKSVNIGKLMRTIRDEVKQVRAERRASK